MSARLLAFDSSATGVGKSTCAVSAAVMCSELGLRTIILDFDGTATPSYLTTFKNDDDWFEKTVSGFSLSLASPNVDECVTSTLYEGLRLLPGRGPLETSNAQIPARNIARSMPGLFEDYDRIVVDLPSSVCAVREFFYSSGRTELVFVTRDRSSDRDSFIKHVEGVVKRHEVTKASVVLNSTGPKSTKREIPVLESPIVESLDGHVVRVPYHQDLASVKSVGPLLTLSKHFAEIVR